MSYEPTNWKDGDLVTSAKLNKLEQGVANGGGNIINMIYNKDDESFTLDKTWQEIWDNNYTTCLFTSDSHDKYFAYITGIYPSNYIILINAGHFISYSQDAIPFIADNANDYPTMTPDEGGGDR